MSGTIEKTAASIVPRPGNAFDFVRLLAAFGVLFSHSFLVNRLPELKFFDGETLGQVCVFVFFAVSGYLIQSSWARSKNLREFAVNRALRIYPGLIVCLLVTTFFLAPVVSTSNMGIYFTSSEPYRYFYSSLVMLFQPRYVSISGVFDALPDARMINGSLWTIRYELTMYAVLAGLALLSKNNVRTLFVVVIGCMLFWVGAIAYGSTDPMVALWRLSYLGLSGYLLKFAPFFLVGAILAKIRPIYLNTYAAIIAALILAITANSKFIVILLWVLLPYCIVVFAHKAPRWLHHVGKHGDFSYGVYLYAFPIQQALIHFGVAQWWHQLVAASVITFFLAALSWRFVESPALRLKRRVHPNKMPIIKQNATALEITSLPSQSQ